MRRILSILLIMLLMAACVPSTVEEEDTSTDTTSQETDATSDVETETSTSDSDDANTLTVWCWDQTFNIYAMNEAGKIYQEDHPDFSVDVIETPWDDVQTKLTTAATSNQLDTLPDILLIQDNAFQKNYANYPDAFTDLSDSGIAFDDFASAKLAYSQVDGKEYGVPFDNGTCILALRTDLISEAGLTVDDFTDITWDEFIELGLKVKDATGMPILSGQAGSPDLIMEMLQSCGASCFNEDGSLNIVGNEVLEEAIDVYTEMVEKGIFVEVNDWDQYVATLTNSTVAGTLNGSWIIGSIQAAEDQSGNWQITNCPSLNDIDGATNYSNNGGSTWMISSSSTKKDLAMDFLKETFAGSVDLYATILPSSGALATYLPAKESDIYSEPSDFFGGQAIFSMIMDYSAEVPSNYTSPYYYEARDAIGVAMTNVVGGADVDSELEAAEETVEFQMGE